MVIPLKSEGGWVKVGKVNKATGTPRGSAGGGKARCGRARFSERQAMSCADPERACQKGYVKRMMRST